MLRQGQAGPRLAEAAPGAGAEGRLGGQGAGRSSRRLGVPVQRRSLPRSRRHRRGRDGDGSACGATPAPENTTRRSRAAASGSRGCRAATAAGAAFDANNLEYYLNNTPFSDHGALLDPPTEDVTARCISMLGQLGETAESNKAMADGIAYLRRTQLRRGFLVRPLGT